MILLGGTGEARTMFVSPPFELFWLFLDALAATLVALASTLEARSIALASALAASFWILAATSFLGRPFFLSGKLCTTLATVGCGCDVAGDAGRGAGDGECCAVGAPPPTAVGWPVPNIEGTRGERTMSRWRWGSPATRRSTSTGWWSRVAMARPVWRPRQMPSVRSMLASVILLLAECAATSWKWRTSNVNVTRCGKGSACNSFSSSI